MKSRIYSSAITCVMLAAWSVFGVAVAAGNKQAELVPLIQPLEPQAAEKRPRSEFLDADGRLVAIPKGLSGALDPAGMPPVSKKSELLLSIMLLPPIKGAASPQLAISWKGEEAGQLELSVIDVEGQSRQLQTRALAPGMQLESVTLSAADHTLRAVLRDAKGHELARAEQSVGWSMPVLDSELDTVSGGAAEQLSAVAAPVAKNTTVDWKATFTGNDGPSGSVLSMTIYDDGTGPALVIGGSFTTAGGTVVSRIARWNGSAWSALGVGMSGPTSAGNGVGVFSLTVYNGDLIAGGFFTSAGGVPANNIARWNGSAWSALGTGVTGTNPQLTALMVYGGDLIAAGQFTIAGGATANNIARWNGTAWSALGSGTNGNLSALTVYNGDLIAGGSFNTAGGVSASNIARWNGSAWSALRTGIAGPVQALTVYSGALIVGGNFTTADQTTANNIARWNGGSWSTLGTGVDGSVEDLTVFNGSLIAGGGFVIAGGVTANKIASWNGSAWSTLGMGMNTTVIVLMVRDSELIAGGNFSTAGGVNVSQIARWNGSAWSAIGRGMGGVSFPRVYALTVYNSDLIVAGFFTIAGGTTVNRVARWNGSGWSSLGTGMNNPVEALTVYGGDLIAGGDFLTAGGMTVNNIARWNGSAWSALGTGMDSIVRALGVYNGDLIAGGEFLTAGGVAANRIARWNGSTWSALGLGITSFSARVDTLTVYNGDLIAAGGFSTAGGVSASSIARWNGNAWSALGTGVNNFVYDLAVYNGELIAGGLFTSAGGVAANRIARWNGSTWSTLGAGMNDRVEALTVYGGELIAGGFFDIAGAVSANQIARWNGSAWFALGEGMGTGNNVADAVVALTVYNGDLIAGGGFATAGIVVSPLVAAYGAANLTDTVITQSGPSIPGGLVNLRVRVSANTAPTAGHVTISGAPGGSCSDLSLTPITATTSEAECSVRWNTFGPRTLNARFVGGAANGTAWQPSSSTSIIHSVLPAILSTSGSPSVVNSAVTLTATVSSINPTGTVQFRDGGEAIATCTAQPVSATGSTWSATCSTSQLPQGLRTLTAVYSGDANNASGTSNQLTQNVQFPTFVITPAGATLPAGTVGAAYGPVTFGASGAGTVAPFAYFASSALPAGLSLNESTGVLSGTPTEGGAFTVSIVVQDRSSTAVNGPFSSPLRNYNLTITSNVAPSLVYAPTTGTPINLTGDGTLLGNPADGSVSITVNGGLGSGNATLGCNVSGGNFTLQGSPVGAINPGTTPVPIALRCTRTAASQNGSLSCNETSNPAGTQQTRTWPLVCPPASAVSPTLAYVPTFGNAVSFPDGAVNQTVAASIQVTTNTPAVGAGSTALSCTPLTAPFSITGGNNQTLNAAQGGVPLQLSCQLGPTAVSRNLSCTETDSPSGTQRSRSWQLSCPIGTAVTLGKVTVGSKISGRGATVSIPISFKGEAVAPLTNSLTAEVSFDRTKLAVLKVQGVAGATCLRRPAPNDDRIILQRSTPGALLAEDTRYCEVTFRVADNAPGGAIVLAVVASTCIDTGGTPRRCTEENGRVAVAALDPAPVDGALIQIAGHVGTLEQTRDLRVANRNVAGEAAVAVNCALDPVTANLRIVQPSQFPLNIAAQTTGVITLSCTLPPLNQPRLATLECNTNDPMRSVMRYPVSCTTYPVGASLPAQQVLDIEQRAGEQIGTSAARSGSVGGAVTALGAPLGGSDGQGRVLVFEDAANSALRAIASIEAPESSKSSEKSNAAKAANAINAVSMQLGQAVALRADGSQLAVGAPFAPFDAQGASGRGQVLLYDRPATGWRNFDSRTATPITLEAPPTFPGGGLTAEFGTAVAYTANGDLVVGAPGSTVSVSGVGVIFVYAWNGTGLEPPASVTSPGAFGGGRFGGALAVRNNQIVVGAVGEFTDASPAPIRTGTAYRIALQSGSPGAAVRIMPTTALAANDRFGSALVITNNLLLIGASGDDTSVGIDSGSAFVFKPGTSASGWVEASQLVPSTGSGAGQEMGAALSTNGDLIFVGAPMADVNALSDRGRVYVYPVKANYAAQEQPTSTLENEGGKANDEFGRAVVASGASAIVGVPKADLLLSAGDAINDVGRGDAFLLEKLFGDGFE